LDFEAALLICQKTAAALAHMHRRGILHGDLRPAKIMLSQKGQVKVRGYGLNMVKQAFRDQIKTPASYTAPERAKERVLGETTDLFSLGATMYHILTGRAPGDAMGDDKRLTAPARVNARIPVALNNLI